MEQSLYELKIIYEKIHEILEDEACEITDFDNLFQDIYQFNIFEDKVEFKKILRIITKISNNHFRSPGLFIKAEKILKTLKIEINNHFTNLEIFDIFKNNKRLLLFLFQEKIIIPNSSILSIMKQAKYRERNYLEYFYTEFSPFFDKEMDFAISEMNNEEFEAKRQLGENDSYICQLIREDLIDDFVIYMNKTDISFSSRVRKSIFETNSLLIDVEPSLIEYAAYYGSIQIFQYLRINNAKLTDYLWLFAVHQPNGELIYLLQESNISPEYNSYERCLIEAIKCHHNSIKEYIQTNLYDGNSTEIIASCIKYFNFGSFPNSFEVDSYIFYFLCKYEFNQLIKIILNENQSLDINSYRKKYINFLPNDSANSMKLTPLCISIQKQNIETIKILLEHKNIDVNRELKYKTLYPMYIQGKKVYKYSETPLYITVENENIEILNLLIQNKNINVNQISLIKNQMYQDEYTALRLAIEKENLEIIKLLINIKNIDINANIITWKYNFLRYEKSYLNIAIEKENLKIVQLLLSNKYTNQNVLYKKIYKESFDEKPFDEDLEIKTPLQMAVERNCFEIVQFLLSSNKVNINQIGQDHEEQQSHQIIKKETALHIAVKNNSLKMVQLLMARKDIDVNAKYCKYEQFKKFKKGDSEEKTALTFAVESQNVQIIKVLLNRKGIHFNIGCIKTQLNKKEAKTVLDIANEIGNQEIINLLKDYISNESYTDYFQRIFWSFLEI